MVEKMTSGYRASVCLVTFSVTFGKVFLVKYLICGKQAERVLNFKFMLYAAYNMFHIKCNIRNLLFFET